MSLLRPPDYTYPKHTMPSICKMKVFGPATTFAGGHESTIRQARGLAPKSKIMHAQGHQMMTLIWRIHARRETWHNGEGQVSWRPARITRTQARVNYSNKASPKKYGTSSTSAWVQQQYGRRNGVAPQSLAQSHQKIDSTRRVSILAE